MFKTGQRVWDTHNKQSVTFQGISEEQTSGTIAIINRNNIKEAYLVNLLHETADDMFEALEFKTEYGLIYKGKNNEVVCFNVDKKEYFAYEKVAGDILPLRIKPLLSKAIHQKGIELSWW